VLNRGWAPTQRTYSSINMGSTVRKSTPTPDTEFWIHWYYNTFQSLPHVSTCTTASLKTLCTRIMRDVVIVAANRWSNNYAGIHDDNVCSIVELCRLNTYGRPSGFSHCWSDDLEHTARWTRDLACDGDSFKQFFKTTLFSAGIIPLVIFLVLLITNYQLIFISPIIAH